MNNDERRFLDIRRESGLKSREVAQSARLPLATEYLAEIGGAVSASDAAQICQAFSRLTGKRYSIEELGIVVKPQREPEHLNNREVLQRIAKTVWDRRAAGDSNPKENRAYGQSH